MGLGLTTWILVAPLLAGAESSTLPAGAWPAGVLLAAVSRVAERPVYPESPRVGNTRVIVERTVEVGPAALPELRGILLDGGIDLVELDPGRPREGWIAILQGGDGGDRPRIALRVVRLRHADPEELAAIVEERIARRESTLAPGSVVTRCIPDPRTGSLIIRSASTRRLQELIDLVELLDAPSGSGERGPVMRTYRPRHRIARELKELLEAAWSERGGFPIRVVVPPDHNLLLIRAPKQSWSEAERLLVELDVPDR